MGFVAKSVGRGAFRWAGPLVVLVGVVLGVAFSFSFSRCFLVRLGSLGVSHEVLCPFHFWLQTRPWVVAAA